MTIPEPLTKLLGEIFDETRDVDDDAVHVQKRDEFVFHMTDWITDLERMSDLYRKPQQFETDVAKDIVAGMLYQAVGHLVAAARLFDYAPDPFHEPAAPALHPLEKTNS